MKRYLLIFCLLLVFSIIISGCTTTPATTTTASSASGTTTNATTTAKPTETTGPTEPTKLIDKETTLTVMLAESNLVPISQDMLHFQWLRDLTNIVIEFQPVPSADYQQKKSTLLSTNDLPDIIQLSQADINSFADTGILVDLSQYADLLPNFYEKVDQYPEAKFTFIDGKPFGIPTLNRWDMQRGSAIVVRKDLMDKLDIDSPKTFDDYYGMLRKFKENDTNTVPYVNRNGSKNLMNTLGYALGSGSGIMYDPQAEKYLFQPAKAETKNVLTYLNNMYNDGLLDADYISVTGTQWEEKIANGTGLSYLDNTGFANRLTASLKEIVPDAEWTCIITPINEFGYSRGLFTAQHQLGRIWAISTDSGNIEVAVKLFNWFYTEEACDLMNLGEEDVDFVRNADSTLSFTDATLKKYSNESGIFDSKMMHKDRGNAAYESFVPYTDLHSYFMTTDPILQSWYTDVIQKDPGYIYPMPAPPFTADEREKVTTYTSQLDTIAVEMFDKLIMGIEPIDSFDTYLERFKSAGLDELEKIYNDAYARIQ